MYIGSRDISVGTVTRQNCKLDSGWDVLKVWYETRYCPKPFIAW